MKRLAALPAILAGLVLMVFIGGSCSQKADEQAGAPQAETSSPSGDVKWMGYDEGMKKAASEGKYILADFYTTWCKYCIQMDKETFSDAAVKGRLAANFVAVKVNAEGTAQVTLEGKTVTEAELARAMGVSGYPTLWFFDKNGRKIKYLAGYSPADEFGDILDYVSTGAMERNEDFQAFTKSRQTGK